MGAPRLILIPSFWPGAGNRRPPPTAKPTGKGGGLRPQPFLVGFAVGRGRRFPAPGRNRGLGWSSHQERLEWSIDTVWLIGFLVCFAVGPGGFREGPGSPRNPDTYPWGASRGPPEPMGPGPQKLNSHTCWPAPRSIKISKWC